MDENETYCWIAHVFFVLEIDLRRYLGTLVNIYYDTHTQLLRTW